MNLFFLREAADRIAADDALTKVDAGTHLSKTDTDGPECVMVWKARCELSELLYK